MTEADDFRALNFKSCILTGSLADSLADSAPWGCYEVEGCGQNESIRNEKSYTLTFKKGPGLMVAMSPVPSCEGKNTLIKTYKCPSTCTVHVNVTL